MDFNFELRYNPHIYLDIQKAVDFYTEETKSDQLGRRFIQHVEITLSKLNQAALNYQVRFDDVRMIPVPSFPFLVHYRVSEETNTVFVEAIFHVRENPETWQTRLKK
ncbi:type II toxin-antitoxin system RelE/ParE family toxin [Algoriphagus hitonicola]|uniref:ParE toxin of type II toxin-antitoxin system, parDE n=1 Tax=Algoriphagus hitonicola TaxID=435880 RepID=A0A1I2NZR8_9BACT|nr:type II toxin-antitoxin system RelE/ParE family toxin [Algoriphagus hitonicola]SFG06751.1 ParE toxin of type II toxin-antitoxin system, parDE [Algoriphagus hitonicola]